MARPRTMHWFRWYHGTVSDPKLQLIASQCGTTTANVIALWAMILERASDSKTRGSFDGIDIEVASFFLGIDPKMTSTILSAMEGKLIENNRVKNWSSRQPLRERERTGKATNNEPLRTIKNHNEPIGTTKTHSEPFCPESRVEESRVDSDEKDINTKKHIRHIVAGSDEFVRADEPESMRASRPAKIRLAVEEQFEELWKAYPKRIGSNPKQAALKQYKNRLKEKHTHQEMLEGVLKYARFAQNQPEYPNQYTCMASTFLGPQKRFLDEMDILPDNSIPEIVRLPDGSICMDSFRAREIALAKELNGK